MRCLLQNKYVKQRRKIVQLGGSAKFKKVVRYQREFKSSRSIRRDITEIRRQSVCSKCWVHLMRNCDRRTWYGRAVGCTVVCCPNVDQCNCY